MSLPQRRISPGGCSRPSTRTALPGAPSTFPPVPGNTQQPPAALTRPNVRSHTTWPGMRMLSERIRSILPPDTALTWETIAPIVPPTAYLGGGTAIAVHVAHRVSRDLDFFFHRNSVNLEELTTKLSAAGPFAVTERAPGTLNGVFSATRVQFLHADEARPQRLLESPAQVDGLRIARISDLMAMKLKVVGDRGELRDYFDLMTIEQRTGRMVDEGLALFSNASSLNIPTRRSTTSCSASATSTTSTLTTPCLSHVSRSLTTGHADSGKLSPPAAASRPNDGSVRLTSGCPERPQ